MEGSPETPLNQMGLDFKPQVTPVILLDKISVSRLSTPRNECKFDRSFKWKNTLLTSSCVFFILFFNYSRHSIFYQFQVYSTVARQSYIILCKLFPLVFLVPTRHHSYYNTIDNISYAVFYIPVTDL